MAGRVIILSGPIGAGKTTVAGKLVERWDTPLAYIEGDKFWRFIARRRDGHRGEDFRVIMRAMTAAAIPFAKSGYDVLLDFSVPPDFLKTARAILKEIALDFVVLLPSLSTCARRAGERKAGRISEYDTAFYAMFEGAPRHTISGRDEVPASEMAGFLFSGINAGAFRVAA